MKIKQTLATLILLLSIISFNSCLGDKGNVLQSYDVGTIINNNGQPIIKTDNIHISLTGAGLSQPTDDEINRALFTFSLDWDNQPDGAYDSGIYSADLNIQERWIATEIEAIANMPFVGSDSLNNISEPYLTTVGDVTMITFESSYEVGENTSIQIVEESNNEATNTLTLDYIYYTGNESTVTTTQKKWQSYILPKFETNYNIILRFKSLSTPTFKSESYRSPDGDKYKNCYLYTMQYKVAK
ncbi:MAG: hypothetical protein IKY54_07430 [Muribaculaceae bacterium]|nr:hypothetical protein [Muribaculaceae bacterium]